MRDLALLENAPEDVTYIPGGDFDALEAARGEGVDRGQLEELEAVEGGEVEAQVLQGVGYLVDGEGRSAPVSS